MKTTFALFALAATATAKGLNPRWPLYNSTTIAVPTEVTSTIFTTVTTCPVTSTYMSGSVTHIKTTLTTSTIVVTSCKYGCHTTTKITAPTVIGESSSPPKSTGTAVAITPTEITSTAVFTTVTPKSTGTAITITPTGSTSTAFFTTIPPKTIGTAVTSKPLLSPSPSFPNTTIIIVPTTQTQVSVETVPTIKSVVSVVTLPQTQSKVSVETKSSVIVETQTITNSASSIEIVPFTKTVVSVATTPVTQSVVIVETVTTESQIGKTVSEVETIAVTQSFSEVETIATTLSEIKTVPITKSEVQTLVTTQSVVQVIASTLSEVETLPVTKSEILTIVTTLSEGKTVPITKSEVQTIVTTLSEVETIPATKSEVQIIATTLTAVETFPTSIIFTSTSIQRPPVTATDTETASIVESEIITQETQTIAPASTKVTITTTIKSPPVIPPISILPTTIGTIIKPSSSVVVVGTIGTIHTAAIPSTNVPPVPTSPIPFKGAAAAVTTARPTLLAIAGVVLVALLL